MVPKFDTVAPLTVVTPWIAPLISATVSAVLPFCNVPAAFGWPPAARSTPQPSLLVIVP